MKAPSLIKHIVSAVTYILLLSGVLTLNNMGVNWLLHNAITPFFAWFYHISALRKALIIFGGSMGIALFLERLFQWIGKTINLLISRVFIENIPTIVVSITLCLTNFILCTFYMLPLLKWNFWIIVMWLMILGFIYESNRIFLYKGKISMVKK